MTGFDSSRDFDVSLAIISLYFILKRNLKDWRGIFLVDECLSDTFKIHYNKILAASNNDQHSTLI